MGKNSLLRLVLGFAVHFAVSAPAFAVSADVGAALELEKQHLTEECEKKKIQVQLFVAHQHHDQDKLDALAPELDAINKRLKPTEDKLKAFKANIKKNPDDESAYEEGLLKLGNCE